MEIVWLGHSSVRLKGNTVTVITDPYANSVGLSLDKPQADIVTISNDHPHHSHSSAITGSPRILSGPGEYEISNFRISGMATRLQGDDGVRRTNTVFTFRAEGLTLCHLGDLTENLSPKQIDELSQADVCFVPAGGVCTLDAARIMRIVRLIDPRILIPIHYNTEGVKVELDPLDKLLSELGVADITPQAKLNVTSTNLPAELRVVVLQKGS
ncbi:MAG: MBL fold metallo-hydrolase [Chloroflexi bacterium]|nr:MBL fold metallo-hydrolase [Chloroflexota bacterium]